MYDFAREVLVRDIDKSRRVWDDLYRKKKRDWR